MTYYAYYNPENMKITGLSNSLDTARHHIEIDEETYVEFVTGKKNMRSYRVISTPTNKRIIPKKTDDDNFDIGKSVHEFKKIKEYNGFAFKENTLYVIQDKISKCWKGKLIPNGIEVNLSHLFIDSKNLYITEVNNPNILLQTINTDMGKFLSGEEFVMFDKGINRDVSLYAQIQHEEFVHLVRDHED